MFKRMFGKKDEEPRPVAEQPLRPIPVDSRESPGPLPAQIQEEPALRPADWSTTGLILTNETGDIGVSLKTAAEAKLAVKDLRLRKRALNAEKRLVTQQMAAIRRDYTVMNANRGPSMRGGGNVGKIVRSMDSVTRSIERSNRERDLMPLDERKRWYEARVNDVDALIQRLEAYMVQLEAQGGISKQPEVSAVCGECGTTIDPGAKFCAECGVRV